MLNGGLPSGVTNAEALASARLRGEVALGIIELMHSQKLNQTQLADRLGVSKARVSTLLSGEHNFTLDTLSRVLYALGRGVRLAWTATPTEFRAPVDEVTTQPRRVYFRGRECPEFQELRLDRVHASRHPLGSTASALPRQYEATHGHTDATAGAA